MSKKLKENKPEEKVLTIKEIMKSTVINPPIEKPIKVAESWGNPRKK